MCWCYFCVSCEDVSYVSMYVCVHVCMCQCICILYLADAFASLVHTVFYPVAHYGYLLPTVYLYMVYIENSYFDVCGCRTWICRDIICFYEEQRQPFLVSPWPACPTNCKSGPSAGRGKFRHTLHSICDSSTSCGCVVIVL